MAKNKFSVGGGADFSGITKELEQVQKTMKEFQDRMLDSYKRIVKALSRINIEISKEEK